MRVSPKLIIVANRLPISIRETPEGLSYSTSIGGMAAALNPILVRDPATVWVGWNGMDRRLTAEELRNLHLPKQLEPLSLTSKFYNLYYANFSNGSLWPLFHGFKPRRMYDETDWQAALAVTRQFADKIIAIANPDDVVWIHDFHLIMLPKILREKGFKNRLGYFLHIPFATPELLKTLPNYHEMLESLQLVDVCGFQTKDDVRRFKKCLKTFGKLPASHVSAAAFPVSIDYMLYSLAPKAKGFKKQLQAVQKRVGTKKLILSVSRLDYTKGILQQLRAVERLLAESADPKAFMYKLIVAPSRESLVEYQEIRHDIGALVDHINERFGQRDWRPIEYEDGNMYFDELVAWYDRADIMLVTPLIDGMNLVAKEYIAVKSDNKGVLIISKTAGAAKQLVTALQVDPTDLQAIVDALKQAVTMPIAERRERHKAMRRNVQKEDAFYWAESFTNALVAGSKT